MKQFIFFILCSAQALLTFGQVNFPTENACWCYNKYGDMGENLGVRCIYTSDIVEINGISYTTIEAGATNELQSDIFYREEGGRFYILPKDSIDEIMVYDFNLEVGDSFTTQWAALYPDPITLNVQQIDTVTYNDGIQRKCISLTNNEGADGRWIEGIGAEQSFFYFPIYTLSVSGGFNFICFSQDGATIYGDQYACNIVDAIIDSRQIGTIELFPNPVEHTLTFTIDNINARSIYIYSSSGRLVLQQEISSSTAEVSMPIKVPPGIYYAQIIEQSGKTILGKFIKN